MYPATAHSTEDLDEWVTAWIDTALDMGVTLDAFDAYMDMARRHPGFFGRPVPVRRTAISKTRIAGPPSVGTVPVGVEQWRNLVAAYWPAGLVDTALCIIDKESRGNPSAKNPRSTARGLFQILASLWAPHFGVTYNALYNPELNIRLAYKVYLLQGWRAWTVHQACGV